MGIVADNAAEVFQRTKGDPLTDLRTATTVELLGDATGKIWINVDGMCLLRVQSVQDMRVDVAARTQDKTVAT